MRYQPFAYARTRSRDWPPSNFQTGTPSDLPRMSQHAISIAATAAAVDLATVGVHVTQQPASEPLDAGRVFADDERLQLVDGRLDRAGKAVGAALTETGDALVGVHQREDPVLPRVADHHRFYGGDAHVAGLRLSGNLTIWVLSVGCLYYR